MMCWIATSLGHSFTVESKGHVFVRRLGVMECFGFDEHYQLSKQLSRPQHFQFNIKAEHEGVRVKAKQKPVMFPSDTDDEVEIVAHSAPALLQARASKRTLEPSPWHQNKGPVRSHPYLQLEIPSQTLEFNTPCVNSPVLTLPLTTNHKDHICKRHYSVLYSGGQHSVG